MRSYLANVCCKLMFLLLLLVCNGLIGATFAFETEQNKVVRSWSNVGDRSQPSTEKIFSSTDAAMEKSSIKQPSYRNVRSKEISTRTLANGVSLLMNYCGRVERIDPVVLSSTGNEHVNSMLAGTVAIPVDRRGAGFLTEIAIPATSGYIPAEKNIAEPIHYQISLITDDGNRHVIIQQISPQFEVGEVVRLNRDGFLEVGDCAR